MTEHVPLWLSEGDVVALLDLRDAALQIEAALRAEAAGNAVPLPKTHVGFGSGHGLHALGGVWEGTHVAGTKTWAHTNGGAAPLLVLFDTNDGALVAVIEAFALGQLRTSAISAIATAALARHEAAVLGVVGAGKQALAQVAAVITALPISSVRVMSLRRERRDALARVIEDELEVEARAVDSVAEATTNADVVTLVTRATEPFLQAEHLRPGTHINAVGAITRERREFDPAILERCSVIASDSVAQARAESSELRDHFGDDDGAWASVTPLADLVASGASRTPDADLTLFKAMGVGLADVALGVVCVARATAEGAGRPLDPARRAAPRLRTSASARGTTR